MGTRAEHLATKVEQSANDLLAVVEASTPEQWAAPCSDGEWSQGFAAFHAAAAIALIAQRVKEVAGGQPFPKMSMDDIHAGNAVQAKEHADCTTSETVDLIRGLVTGRRKNGALTQRCPARSQSSPHGRDAGDNRRDDDPARPHWAPYRPRGDHQGRALRMA